MSKPGSSWLPMPVTETVLPVLSKILTSEPERPSLAPYQYETNNGRKSVWTHDRCVFYW